MSKIYMQTLAYNAKSTIRRCIESILNQTYKGEIHWDILDNGSTDDTFSILSDYARRDARLNIFHIDCNCSPRDEKEQAIWDRFCKRTGLDLCDGEYYCILDSDDEYKPDFLEKTLSFMKENNLDIAAAGCDFIDTKTNKAIGIRQLNRNIILSDVDTYSDYFSDYHQFFRAVWGKVYKMSLLKNYLRNDKLSYGSDTWFAFYTARQAARIGILAESLHKYYISPKSISYQWNSNRIVSDRILHETACSFLTEKCGAISPQNKDFLLVVYMKALRDTLTILLNAQISAQEKIAGIIDIFTHEYTGELMAKDHLGLSVGSVADMSALRRELFSTVANWLLSVDEVQSELVEGYCSAGELLSAATENANAWLFFKKLRVRFFLEQNRTEEARDSLFELVELMPNDPEVMELQQSF